MPSLIQRLRDSAAHYRRFMFPWREVFPGRSVQRHVALLEEAADELDGKGKFDSIAWQGCLDHANKNAAAARADADRLRNQLFEAREQRDGWRHDSDEARKELESVRAYKKDEGMLLGGGFWAGPVTVFNEHGNAELVTDILKRAQKAEAGARANGAEAERARTELVKWKDEALAARQHVCAAPVNVYSSTPPHDHVVISLAGYNKLVTERDEALAKYAACVGTISFIDGPWTRTS